MQHVPERQAWVDQQHQHAIHHEGAMHIEGHGTFAPAEGLPAADNTMTLDALHRIIRGSHTERGRVEGPVRELGASPNWNALAGGQPPEQRHDIANDPYVEAYLAHRNNEVATATMEAVTAYPEILKSLTTGVKDGIQKGYIPARVASRLESLRKTQVKVVDTEVIHDEAPHAAADYDISTDEFRWGHSHVKSDKSSVIAKHELLHKLAGGTFVQDSETGTYSRTRTGFTNFERGNQRLGLTEATNQHITMGVETGDFETFDPDLRTDGDDAYYASRKIVAEGLKRSGGVMSVRALTRASFEDSSDKLDAVERRELVKEATAAYGPGALRKLDALAVAAEGIPHGSGYQDAMRQLADRIHAPELNTDGTVRAVGSIDLKDL